MSATPDLPTLFALAVALAMDAFAVAVATGICLRCVTPRQTFRLAWHFGLFQALMPVLGWTLGLGLRGFMEQWAHWVAFALLLVIGGRMLHEALNADAEQERCDPTRGWPLVLLSVATSIDALAVGFSLSLLGSAIALPALIIGVVCFGFTAVGLHMGRLVTRSARLSRVAEALGGVVLVGIGLNILRNAGVFG